MIRAAALVVAAAAPAVAQLPQTRLGFVFPPGGQAGSTFELRVGGEQNVEYARKPGLIFSHPGITAEAVADGESGSWPDRAFRVTIPDDVPAGRYEVLLDGYYGASNPQAFRVERDRTIVERDGPADAPVPISLEEVVYGRLATSADVDSFTFAGDAGRTVVISCDAEGIDSPVNPIVELRDPNGRTVYLAGGPHSGAARLAATLPATGAYSINVFDAGYRGGSDFAYRLRLSARPVVAFVWPPAGPAGATTAAEVYGYNLPGGVPAAEHPPLMRRNVEVTYPPLIKERPTSGSLGPAALALDGFDYRFELSGDAANPVPLYSAPQPLVPESESNDAGGGERIAVPSEIAGRFDHKGDSDRFLFEARKGDRLALEAYAARYGSAADPVMTIDRPGGPEGQPRLLTVQDDLGGQGGEAVFDETTSDPAVMFEAPEDGTYRVTLRDRFASSRGGLDLFYRLSVRRPEPDFRLAVVPAIKENPDAPATASSVVLRKGESVEVTVVASRRDGFDGPIEVKAADLPAGLESPGVTIAAQTSSATLALTAAGDAPAWRGTITVSGEANISDADGTSRSMRRTAVAGTLLGDGKIRPVTGRIAGPLTVSILDETAPFRLTGPGGVLRGVQGGQVLVPLHVTRGAGDRKPVPAITVNAVGLTEDAKVTAESNPFREDGAVAFVRLLIGQDAPARPISVSFRADSKTDYKAFPHHLKRASTLQAAVAGRLAQAEELEKKETAARDEAAQRVSAAEQERAVREQAVTDAAAEIERLRIETAAKESSAKPSETASVATESSLPDVAASGEADELARLRERSARAEQARIEAAKRAAEAATALGAATRALQAREAAVKQSGECRKREEASKKVADQLVAEAEKAAAPKNVDFSAFTSPVTLSIVPSPVRVEVQVPNEGRVARGQTLEIGVKAGRENGYEGPITLSLALPPGPGGLTAETVTMKAGEGAGVLRVTAESGAAEGEVPFPAIRATFDSPESAPLDIPVSLKVVP